MRNADAEWRSLKVSGSVKLVNRPVIGAMYERIVAKRCPCVDSKRARFVVKAQGT
jgi:hypothetical protein